LTGARRGESFPVLPVHPELWLGAELLPPDDAVPLDPLEPEDDEPEDEPESRGVALPTVGLSAGRERSCAATGDRLSAKAAAAAPIVIL
jgi:hypothetical protein